MARVRASGEPGLMGAGCANAATSQRRAEGASSGPEAPGCGTWMDVALLSRLSSRFCQRGWSAARSQLAEDQA